MLDGMYPDVDDPDVLMMLISVGPPGDDEVVLRMSPEVGRDVVQLLDQQGISHSPRLEASFSTGIAIEAVAVLGASAGFLASLSAILNTVLRRHDGKSVKFERDGDKIEITGLPEKTINRLLQKRFKQLEKRNAEWERAKDQPKPGE